MKKVKNIVGADKILFFDESKKRGKKGKKRGHGPCGPAPPRSRFGAKRGIGAGPWPRCPGPVADPSCSVSLLIFPNRTCFMNSPHRERIDSLENRCALFALIGANICAIFFHSKLARQKEVHFSKFRFFCVYGTFHFREFISNITFLLTIIYRYTLYTLLIIS